MQSSVPSELNKPSNNRRRRRRRPRNKRKQNKPEKQVEIETKDLDLGDLTAEAHALEKQLTELQTQLQINYSNIPSKEKGRIANAIATEQITATEDEIDYVRSSLRKTYRQIINTNLVYASTHHIEDKLWRYIFYANIEEIRSKLRKAEREGDTKHLQKILSQRIDDAFKFYRELNQTIKSTFHITDVKVLGIEFFRQSSAVDEKIGALLQSDYNCMGDLARYHAQQAMASKGAKKVILDYWSMAKTCYQRAVDVYRKNGKPYCQLALVSMSNGNVMDVVWYYCMSLAVKQPSSVGRDNLKSFYSKIRFHLDKPQQESATAMISKFAESFLHMHRTVMFNQKSPEEFDTMLPIALQLGESLEKLILSLGKEENTTVSKATQSTLHVIRTTLTRAVTILLISIWIAGERLKDKANYAARPVILMSQIHMYTFTFNLLTGVYRSSRQALGQIKEKLDEKTYTELESLVDDTLLPGLSIWATFIGTNMTPLAQYSMTAANDIRNREPQKKTLVKSIQSLLSLLISHSSFPDPVLHVLPSTYPVSEDLLLLGLAPLYAFHSQVDFFKEAMYEVMDEKSPVARKQVRWGRIREMIKKFADSSSFDFIQYNVAEQKYSVIDENAKRQQQNRFMKALATQRLMEQVSSLEKNVSRMSLKSAENDPKQSKEKTKRDIYTCVVDITAFLDGLHKVKKWASQTLNVDRRSQSSILEVIVPLDVIDGLDNHKKGTSHTNMQARESIRFLDQKLLNKTADTTTSYLRTQKVNEKLANWSDAKEFWIGEESRSNVVDNLLSEGEELDDEEQQDSGSDVLSDAGSLSSDDDDYDLFRSRRRANDSESEESSEESDESESEKEDEEEKEVYEYEEHFAEENEEDMPYTLDDVPKVYRPILSCLLYYYSKQLNTDTVEKLVLVTNDEELAWWAELFGNTKTGKRMLIKTVNEWDHMVSKLDFEREYEYSWKQR
ncbi:Protein SMG7 [Choanephora cucurbitarum]|uniref:Protein SMG7 n=1 Tax=Choanephora cucurbitarum TaxID=101091 RepID=A0A1C7NMD3_9FUNG|nr:Protein SMG7 [Choanephora cucurbitarum]